MAHLREPGCASLPGDGRKEPSPLRRLRASWAAAMVTLLATRRSRKWRMAGACPVETGARIGGARAAAAGSGADGLRTVRRSRKSGGFGGHGGLAAARHSHQRRRRGQALHRRAGGQDSVTTGRDRPPDSANRALCSHVQVASIFPKKSWFSHRRARHAKFGQLFFRFFLPFFWLSGSASTVKCGLRANGVSKKSLGA